MQIPLIIQGSGLFKYTPHSGNTIPYNFATMFLTDDCTMDVTDHFDHEEDNVLFRAGYYPIMFKKIRSISNGSIYLCHHGVMPSLDEIINSQLSDEKPPDLYDALFWLDGTVIREGNEYYFKDQSGFGRNFKINGYDFDSTWTKGMPYKSKATISAPAGDRNLIEQDVNSYLYGKNGPNEIPVVSLFQDIDYEHRMFSRHQPQVLSSIGIEIIEPRVRDIVLYKTKKSGENLTNCQTYFNVPTELTTNVKWVSKLGNNSNSGAKDSSWLTISKATWSSGVSGETIYVKTGEYIEDHNVSNNGYLMITKSVKVICTGLVKIKSKNAAQNAFLFDNVNFTIKNAIIGNDTTVTNGVFLTSPSYKPILSLDRCWIKNGHMGLNCPVATNITVSNTIYSGIVNRFISATKTNVIVKNCYSRDNVQVMIGASTGITTTKINYNNFLVGSVTHGYSVDLDISFNKLGILGVLGDSDVELPTSKLRINRNFFNNPNGLTLIEVDHDYYDTEINFNTLMASIEGSEIRFGKQNTSKVKGNILIGTEGKYARINAEAGSVGTWSIDIDGNMIISDGNAHPILVGNENNISGFNRISGRIVNNTMIGSGIANTAHGVSIFNHTGVSITHNYIEGYSFGYIVKVQGTDLSKSDIAYNISKNCGSGISGKGGKNQRIYNNIIINSGFHGIQLVRNAEGTGYDTIDTVFKNNIIYDDLPASSYVGVRYDGGSNIISDNNNFYSVNNSDKFNINGGGTTITLAQWQALGYDLNSIFTNPNLSEKYIPSSPIIIGENLGSDYKKGLDVSTNWGDYETTPIVVYRDQTLVGSWEIGAFVQR